MELFQPNNLSRVKPEFVPTNDPSLREEVEAILRESYGFTSFEGFTIAAFAGANISSQNFKISTNSNSWFLKSRSSALCEQLITEVRLTRDLEKLGQPVPRVISSKSGDTTSSGNKCWVLYEFQEGVYFSGSYEELAATAKAFSELTLAAIKLHNSVSYDSESCDFLDDLNQLLRPDSVNQAKDSTLVDVCSKHRARILATADQVKAHISSITTTQVPLHLDYHPLNILMKETEVVCILDLEHLRPYPVLAGLGFAAYKLIRQAMVSEEFRLKEMSDPSAVKLWIDAWQEHFPLDSFTNTELGLGARFRILQLIHMILEATFKRADHRSNYDLPKQIHSLYEADVVFDTTR